VDDSRNGLLGTLALLAGTVAVLFAIAIGAEEGGTIPAPALTESDAGLGTDLDAEALLRLGIDRAPVVSRRVAEIRGLEFAQIPTPQITDVAALRRLAQDEIAKPRVAELLAAGDAELKLLGLLEPEDSLSDASTAVTAGAAAYYDPEEKELFLLGDAVPAGAALTEFVLAHELNHALEDQVFSLPLSSASNDDRALAETALVEGSATALMTEYAAQHLAVSDLLEDSGAIESDTSDLPPIILAQVTFAYIGGQNFVDELRASANGGWDLVDFAYQRRLPASTEQILHPEKYLDDEDPLPVDGPPGAGPGWEEVDAGAVGEFVTREILRQDADEVGADEAAAGWGGDRYRFFRREGAPAECSDDCRAENAIAIAWRGDDEVEAVELRDALEDFVERSLGGTPEGKKAWEVEGGWAAVDGEGDLATLALAPDEALARRLASPVVNRVK